MMITFQVGNKNNINDKNNHTDEVLIDDNDAGGGDDDEQLTFPPEDDGEEQEEDEEGQELVDHQIDLNLLLDWKFYVDRTVFMTALQDPGCVDPQSRKEQRKIHYPKLKKIAFKIFDKLNANDFPDIHGNKSKLHPSL